LIAGQHEQHEPGQNDDDGHNDLVDHNASLFLVTLVNEVAARDIFGNVEACPDDGSGTAATNRLAENDLTYGDLPLLDRSVDAGRNGNSNQNNTTTPPVTPPSLSMIRRQQFPRVDPSLTLSSERIRLYFCHSISKPGENTAASSNCQRR